MPWSLVNSKTAEEYPSEAWDLLEIPAVVGVLHYAFRLNVDAALPLNYGTAGFWCGAQRVSGRLVYGRSHPITIIGRGGFQGYRIMGPQDVDWIAVQNDEFYLAYSVHKWITRTTIEIFALT